MKKNIFILAIFFSAFTVALYASASMIDLKGAMVYRVASFIEWQNCPDNNTTIAVYEDKKTENRFRHLFQAQSIDGRKVIVKSIKTIDELNSLHCCDILYIGHISLNERSKIIQKLMNKGILTIGNSREDAHSGISVVLLEKGGRYRILINQEALKKSNLNVDYRLLKLAELVHSK